MKSEVRMESWLSVHDTRLRIQLSNLSSLRLCLWDSSRKVNEWNLWSKETMNQTRISWTRYMSNKTSMEFTVTVMAKVHEREAVQGENFKWINGMNEWWCYQRKRELEISKPCIQFKRKANLSREKHHSLWVYLVLPQLWFPYTLSCCCTRVVCKTLTLIRFWRRKEKGRKNDRIGSNKRKESDEQSSKGKWRKDDPCLISDHSLSLLFNCKGISSLVFVFSLFPFWDLFLICVSLLFDVLFIQRILSLSLSCSYSVSIVSSRRSHS